MECETQTINDSMHNNGATKTIFRMNVCSLVLSWRNRIRNRAILWSSEVVKCIDSSVASRHIRIRCGGFNVLLPQDVSYRCIEREKMPDECAIHFNESITLQWIELDPLSEIIQCILMHFVYRQLKLGPHRTTSSEIDDKNLNNVEADSKLCKSNRFDSWMRCYFGESTQHHMNRVPGITFRILLFSNMSVTAIFPQIKCNDPNASNYVSLIPGNWSIK